jgi:predicted ATPase/class 3 adenylate cyclase
MSELPTGTVTFFFSDIEGSTRLLQQCGDRWPTLLERHSQLLRAAFAAHGGIELSTEGDSFFAVFPSASEGVLAAIDAQRAFAEEPWPAETPVRIRIGLHTGEGTLSGANYVGLDVHRAARIMSAAHGAQVLVSATTRELVHGAVPDGVDLVDIGEHRLRDLPEAERLFTAVAPGLQRSFPPPRGVAVAVANLPAELTSFVGREEEIRRVIDLLAEHRVVTLTGPGGTGKTRLSVRVALEARDTNPDGVYFVPLADIREVELVLPTIGHVVGLVDPGRSPLERLSEHLAEKQAMLVLDNLEQVIDAARDVAELLGRATNVRVLCTSRSPLHIYGEVEFPVPPLPMPDPREVPPDATIVRYPAVALFVERARAVRPDFAVSDDNAAAVAEICWRLDGLPLAVELAAARIRLLTPQAIAERLVHRLEVGGGGGRDRPERQQSLRGAISWSYELLDDDERRFFAAVATFRGGADLDAIAAVTSDDGVDPLDAVASLVDKSLIRQEELPDGSVRFGMLETIREYAEERLVERDDAEATRRRHAVHYLELAERLSPRLFDDKAALDRMEREHDNLRAAITWSQERGEIELALRFLPACWRFWQIRFHLPEAAERATRTVNLPGVEEHPALLAAAEEATGGILYWQGDFNSARHHYERALEIQRSIGDDAAVANALYNAASSYIIDLESVGSGVDPRGLAYVREALELYRRIGDRHGEGRVLWASMDAHVFNGERDRARAVGREVLDIFREVGDRFMEAWTEYMLGTNENLAGEGKTAAAHMRRALDYFAENEDRSGYSLAFDGFAASAYHQGMVEVAMRLTGAASALQQTGGSELGKLNREWSDFHPERLLEDPRMAAEYEAGKMMEPAAAIDLARSIPSEEPA